MRDGTLIRVLRATFHSPGDMSICIPGGKLLLIFFFSIHPPLWSISTNEISRDNQYHVACVVLDVMVDSISRWTWDQCRVNTSSFWLTMTAVTVNANCQQRLFAPSRELPSKHNIFIWHLYNVGPTSKTLGRRCTNVIQICCVCWVTVKIDTNNNANLSCKNITDGWNSEISLLFWGFQRLTGLWEVIFLLISFFDLL